MEPVSEPVGESIEEPIGEPKTGVRAMLSCMVLLETGVRVMVFLEDGGMVVLGTGVVVPLEAGFMFSFVWKPESMEWSVWSVESWSH